MRDRYDVVVVGSGSAGSTAAIAAARSGASTLLVDRLGFMGGTSTAVLDTFYAFYTPGEDPRRVVGGIGWEVVERLTADGLAFERPNTYGAGTGVTYDQEALKLLWEQLAEDAGVELLLHTWVTGVTMDGDRITGIRIWNKGGERFIGADAIVDASGDADVSALAGAPVRECAGHRAGPVALDVVQGRERGRRACVGRPQGRALGAHASGRRFGRLPSAAHRGVVASDSLRRESCSST